MHSDNYSKPISEGRQSMGKESKYVYNAGSYLFPPSLMATATSMKTYTLSCHQLGSDCPYTCYGKDPEETMAKMVHHAVQDHQDMMMGMNEHDFIGMFQKMKLALQAA